jgi:hypothetical protein
LCADPDSIADLDILYLWTDANGLPNDLMTNADGVIWRKPARAKGRDIRTADTTVGYLDVNVRLLEWLWLVFSPHHIAICWVGVKAKPPLELVLGWHFGWVSALAYFESDIVCFQVSGERQAAAEDIGRYFFKLRRRRTLSVRSGDYGIKTGDMIACWQNQALWRALADASLSVMLREGGLMAVAGRSGLTLHILTPPTGKEAREGGDRFRARTSTSMMANENERQDAGSW